jgi:hypothetical protein
MWPSSGIQNTKVRYFKSVKLNYKNVKIPEPMQLATI